MNILLALNDPQVISGYTLVPRYLALEFKKLGHQVKILCLHKPKSYLKDETPDMYLTGNILSHAVSFSLQDKINQFNPDVIYTHGMFPSDSLALKFAKKNQIPTFMTVHTKIDEYVKFYMNDSMIIQWLGDLLNQKYIKILNSATKVFALTSEMQIYLKNLGVTNTTIIGNGVDLNVFKPSDHNPINDDIINLVNVGSIQSRKNQLFFFEVARHLPKNIKMNLVGGPSVDPIYYLIFIKELKMNKPENLIYHEELSPEKIAKLMKNSTLYVTASLLEAQSLSQLEACACCLPTVRLLGRNTSGITTDDYNAIHLEENTPAKEFANRIVTLLSKQDKYNFFRENLIKDRGKLSWKLPAELIIQEFTKAIKS